MDVQNVGFHEKCHISVNMRPTDLRQVSKFSLVQYLILFLLHPKDLVCRKNVLGEEKISSFHCKLFTTMAWVKKNGSQRKWHNSVIMRSSDLGQVSKFSLVKNLKLFLWHAKDLMSRKNVLGETKFWKMGKTENSITQWICVLQAWDRCQNFPWFDT